MVGEDRVMMSGKELRRLHVVRQAMEQHITQVQAGTLLGLTDRHVRRLIQRVRQGGDPGLGARGGGPPANRGSAGPAKAKSPPPDSPRAGGLVATRGGEEVADGGALV